MLLVPRQGHRVRGGTHILRDFRVVLNIKGNGLIMVRVRGLHIYYLHPTQLFVWKGRNKARCRGHDSGGRKLAAGVISMGSMRPVGVGAPWYGTV